METTQIQKTQQSELHAKLWKIANDLRGNMDASEFKNYILGLIFFRYLSKKVETSANKLLERDNIDYKTAWKNKDYQNSLRVEIIDNLGYCIEPEYLFSSLVEKIQKGDFDIETLQKSITYITESSLGKESQDDFEGLFDDMDLNNSKLGRDVKSKSKLIAKVIQSIDEIKFEYENTEIDVLGDAYEYLIGQFAASAGKKAGEFYTPQQVSKILAKIVSLGKDRLKNVYDPCCGSGSLLLRVAKEIKVSQFFGQELTSTTFNLARMNMLLHDISYQNFSIYNGDTLEDPYFQDETFEAIVANPPYSAKWTANAKFLDDERFSATAVLAPKTKADYAFVLHMLHHLRVDGTMAVVLPHGVLFRGGSEGKIRQYIIDNKNYLDAVIGLPANIFFGTSIPTVILIFKKQRQHPENILFIDASKDFEKWKNQNLLRDLDVDKIIDHYLKRESVEKYCYVAKLDEVKENDYNLNITRYVDTFEEEEVIDLDATMKEIKKIDKELEEVDEELNKYLRELGLEEF